MSVRALATLAVLALAAAACGGAPSSLAGAVAPSGTASPAVSSAAEPPKLTDLLDAANKVWFMADYRIYAAAQGQSITSEQRWYYASPRLRIDVGDAYGSSLFVLDDQAYACGAVAGRTTCVGLPLADALQKQQGARVQVEVKQDAEKFTTTFDGTKMVAGYQSFCYLVRPRGDTTAQFTESRLCYITNGVLTYQYLKTSDAELRMELLSLGKLPVDAFTLPAKPISLPAATLAPTKR